jgi:hypothetical protein
VAVEGGHADRLPVPCHASLDRALDGTDTAVVTVPWDAFEDPETYRGRSLTLVDPWRLFHADELPVDVSYVPVGARRTTGEGETATPKSPTSTIR